MRAAARLVEGPPRFRRVPGGRAATRPATARLLACSRAIRRGLPVPPDLAGVEAALITYEVTGDGFLRHMVRTIVGTLVEVGRGRAGARGSRRAGIARDRAAGPTAPADGLFLVRVDYGAAGRAPAERL